MISISWLKNWLSKKGYDSPIEIKWTWRFREFKILDGLKVLGRKISGLGLSTRRKEIGKDSQTRGGLKNGR